MKEIDVAEREGRLIDRAEHVGRIVAQTAMLRRGFSTSPGASTMTGSASKLPGA